VRVGSQDAISLPTPYVGYCIVAYIIVGIYSSIVCNIIKTIMGIGSIAENGA